MGKQAPQSVSKWFLAKIDINLDMQNDIWTHHHFLMTQFTIYDIRRSFYTTSPQPPISSPKLKSSPKVSTHIANYLNELWMNVIIDRMNWHSISISDTFLPTQPHCRVSSGRSVSKCEQRGTWSEAPPIERDGRSSCLGFTCTNLFMFIISPEQQTDWRACVGWYPTRERSHSRSVLNLSSDSHHHQYTPCVYYHRE